MKKRQMEGIEKLRHENYSYRFIGDALGISPNTVKSICRRNHYEANGNRKTKAEKQAARVCKNCGTLLAPGGRQGQQFCSDACRRGWWKRHRQNAEKQT